MAKLSLFELGRKVARVDELKTLLMEDPEVKNFLKEKQKFSALPIIYDNFFDEGKDQTIYYCHNCGHSWTVDKRNTYNSYSYYYRPYWKKEADTETCPHCNKKHETYSPNSKISNLGRFAYVRKCVKEDGYALISSFEIVINHTNQNIPPEQRCYNGENIDYLIGDFEVSITEVFESVVSLEYGLRPSAGFRSHLSFGNEILSANSGDFISAKYKLQNSAFVNAGEINNLVEMLSEKTGKTGTLNELLGELDTQYSLKKESKTVKKPKKSEKENEVIDIVLEDLSLDKALEYIKERRGNNNVVISLLYSNLGNIRKYANACTCGEIFDFEVFDENRHATFKCPKCGAEFDSYRARKELSGCSESNLMKYELVSGGEGIVIRIFKLRMNFELEGRKVTHELSEIRRFFFFEKAVKVLLKQSDHWVKGRVTDMDDYCRYNHSSLILVNPKEEMEDIIKNSVFKYSGLLEALGFKDKSLQLNDVGYISRTSYMYVWTKHKCIEQLLKTGLTNIVKSILSNNEVLEKYNKNGTTVYEILGITKPVYLIAKAKNANPSELDYIKKMWELEQSLTLKDYEEIQTLPRADLIVSIKEKFGIPFKKIVEYIKSCYDHQCIENHEALNIWYDYLRMAKDMEYRLKDNTIKFPSSLKKDHDRAMFAYKVAQDQMNQKRFVEAAEINEKLYNYSYGNFFIKVPTHPNEVIQEGNVQKHCVASYVARIRDRETAVCFARKKEDPETAYYTIEVRNGVVVQVKGYCNCAPRDPEFLDFLNKWAEKKSLKLKY